MHESFELYKNNRQNLARVLIFRLTGNALVIKNNIINDRKLCLFTCKYVNHYRVMGEF